MNLLIRKCVRTHQVVEKLGLRTVIIGHHCNYETVEFFSFQSYVLACWLLRFLHSFRHEVEASTVPDSQMFCN